MSSLTAARCRHIKVNGTQCGSPALRSKNFCFYHQKDRPCPVPCYSDIEYATGEITLPFFEDAHSIQAVIRQVVQMVLQKRLEQKTASLLLYALQIASTNLKRMELEKPQPEQVVTDLEPVTPDEAWQAPIARSGETAGETSASASPANREQKVSEVSGEELPPGTIQACYRPGSRTQNRSRQSPPQWKQYVI
jgi:hypothetical protein